MIQCSSIKSGSLDEESTLSYKRIYMLVRYRQDIRSPDITSKLQERFRYRIKLNHRFPNDKDYPSIGRQVCYFLDRFQQAYPRSWKNLKLRSLKCYGLVMLMLETAQLQKKATSHSFQTQIQFKCALFFIFFSSQRCLKK